MKSRIFVCLFVVYLLLAIGTMSYALQMLKGPYLIYPGDNTRMEVLWQLDSTLTCTLEWGQDTSYADGSVQTVEYGSDHQHMYAISSLLPGTKYYYRVNMNGTYFTGSFLSAPADTASNLKFLCYGDTRTYPSDHDSVCAQMVTTFTNDPGYHTFTGHVGDWVSYGYLESDWTNEYFDRGQPNALNMMANLPIMGCMGNHEYDGILYQKYWPYPFTADRYYSFDYGPAHVIILDQYVSYTPGSAQYIWLENELASTTKPWKFLIFHEPGYSSGGHSNNTTVQDYIQPLCLQYAVKVVFVGHNHYYARCEVDGVHHVTTGGGGAPLYTPNPSYPYVVASTEVYNFCEINIQGTQLDFVARDQNGNVIDSFTTDNTIPPALPWSDGFESNDFAAGGWVTSGKTNIVSDVYSGNYAAQTNSTASLTKAVSTLGFSGIHVKYARKTAGLEPEEYLLVEWYDGTTWHEIEQVQDTAWAYVDYLLPVGADENVQFKLRFTAVNADNKEYTYIDQVEITDVGSQPDTTPPDPDPMTWQTLPYATSSTSISMTATTASDPGGVEYYFECTSGGGHDSNWQDNPIYEDTGLQPETQYTYRVKARDKSVNQNETAFSSSQSAITLPGGSGEMYVYDISMSTYKSGPNYIARAIVWIKDTTGANVEGATVYGTWSGDVDGTSQGVTLADGKVTLDSPPRKGGGTYIFTVTNVAKTGYTYNPALNVETSDSITK